MKTLSHQLMTVSAAASTLCAVVALVAVVLSASGCNSEREFSGVFVEDVAAEGLDAARNTAFRLTIYEFSDSVGGFIEYYAVEGLNTPTSPYTKATSCAYFGPVRRSEESVRFDAIAPNGVDTLRVELDSVKRREIGGVIVLDGGTIDESGADDSAASELNFVEDGRRTPAMACPTDVVLLGVEP